MSLVSEAALVATTASPQLAFDLGLVDHAGADFLNRPPRSSQLTRTDANIPARPARTDANGCEPARTENQAVVEVAGDHPQPEHSRWARPTTAVAHGRLALRGGARLLLSDAYEVARDAVCAGWRAGSLLSLNTAAGPVVLPASDVLGVSETWS